MKPVGYDRYVFPQGIDDIDEKTELRDRNPIAWASMKMGAGQNIPGQLDRRFGSSDGAITEASVRGHSPSALPFRTLQQCRAEAARDIPLFEQVAESKYQTIASYRCVVVPDNEQLTFYAGGRDKNGRYGVNPYGLVKLTVPDNPPCAQFDLPWPDEDQEAQDLMAEGASTHIAVKCHVYQATDRLWHNRDCAIDNVDRRSFTSSSADDQKYIQKMSAFTAIALRVAGAHCFVEKPALEPKDGTRITNLDWDTSGNDSGNQ
ncbi:hypothetical protein AA15669_1411 [Saccharibacter floricola DSM 15669]|uniref:Uncharacterized protein n=2 Tax=Saccharibacter TaxID=231052 RepID=A0ABQ0NZT7_9PROT|nr:hypothetical protein AA15669_1411 [Saccharibacter floricola DSM 15669]